MKNKIKADKFHKILGRRPLATILVYLFIFSALIFYQNDIYRIIFRNNHYEKVLSLDSLTVSISQPSTLHIAGEIRARRLIKIAAPISEFKKGCEYTYGLAVYKHITDQDSPLIESDQPRYLIKFKYDLKNQTCESKDLFLRDEDWPESISLQLIHTEVTAESISEEPQKLGYRIIFKGSELAGVFLESFSVPSLYPFIQETVTTKVANFSTNYTPGEVKPLFAPESNLKDILLEEIDQRVIKCQTKKICDKITAAVARIDDPDLVVAFDKAFRSGLPIELITNVTLRQHQELPDYLPAYRRAYAPLFWLRGNPYFETTGNLPMHTKFIIFGDDLVISSNANYNFKRYYYSQEVATMYRNSEVVRMFKEIATLIRTSVFYPLHADQRHKLQILFNADRPRGYSAMPGKPLLTIIPENGRPSSAYDLLFQLFEKSTGALSINMSPLTNSCTYYGKELCLYDILQRKSEQGKLSIKLNLYFYLQNLSEAKKKELKHSGVNLESLPFKRNFKFFEQLRLIDSNAVKLLSMSHHDGSSHHERLALLEPDYVLSGSANYAMKSTLNTIEIIRDPEIFKFYTQRLQKPSDVYIVINHPGDSSIGKYSKDGCEFLLDYDLLNPIKLKPQTYQPKQIEDAFYAITKNQLTDDYTVILPKLSLSQTSVPIINDYEYAPVNKALSSYSSYFCLQNKKTQKVIPIKVNSPDIL